MIRAYGGIQTVLRRKNGEKYMEVPGTTTNSKKERMMQSRMEVTIHSRFNNKNKFIKPVILITRNLLHI